MCEFGAFKFQYPQVSDAAKAMLALQKESCNYNFIGWLFWTFNSDDEAEQPILWSLMSSNAIIGNTLAPSHRPNGVCQG